MTHAPDALTRRHGAFITSARRSLKRRRRAAAGRLKEKHTRMLHDMCIYYRDGTDTVSGSIHYPDSKLGVRIHLRSNTVLLIFWKKALKHGKKYYTRAV